jgi:hypothetical protein
VAKHKKDKRQDQNPQSAQKSRTFSFPFARKHPDWTAWCILFLLLVIFFGPLVFSNKTLMPPDRLASLSGVNFYPQFPEDLPKVFKYGYYPLWNPGIFSGMPSFASLSIPFMDVINDVILLIAFPVQLLVHLIKPIDIKTTLLILVNCLLFGGFTFLFLRNKKLSFIPSLFAGIAIVFMPQMIADTAFGHFSKVNTIALIPLIFLLTDKLLEKQNILYLCLTGLSLGTQLLRQHVQIYYYTHLMILVYFLFWAVCAIKDKEKANKIIKGGTLLACAVIFGMLLSSFMNLSAREYSHFSTRGGGEAGGVGYDYATSWSFPPSEILTFFIPSFMGFGGQTYWGSLPFTDFPQYFGILVFLLAGLALVMNRNRTVWFFTILAALSLLASFGKHLPVLYGPMYKLLPFFNKFRAPNMIHILLQFSMVVLSAYGLQSVLDFSAQTGKDKLKNIKRYLFGFGVVLGLIFLMLLIGKGSYLNWAQKAGENRSIAYDNAVNDALKAVVFYIIAILVVFSTLRKKLGSKGFAFIMIVLLTADLWIVDKKIVQFQDKADEKAYFAESQDVTYLKEQKGLYRILPVEDGRSPNWYMYYKLQYVNGNAPEKNPNKTPPIQSQYGYFPNKLQIYQDLLDAYRMPNAFLMKYLKVVDGQYMFKDRKDVSPEEIKLHNSFLRLLNVRYVLSQYPLPDTTLRMVVPPQAQGLPAVYEVTDSLPRIFFPKRVMEMKGKEAILGFMTRGGFDPAETAILEETLPFGIAASDSNRARITTWALHRIEIQAEIKTPSLLAISEIYYPAGWKAYVDGKESKIYKTDYVLRSVFLDPGKHTVVMEFKPKMLRIGLTVTIATFGLLVLGMVVGISRNRKKVSPPPENLQ